MNVKIEEPYSASELAEILTQLVTLGVLSQAELDQNRDFYAGLDVDFLALNNVLLPVLDRIPCLVLDDRQTAYAQGKLLAYYLDHMLALLHASPLSRYEPQATSVYDHLDSDCFQVHTLMADTTFCFQDYLTFKTHSLLAVNELLAKYDINGEYYPISFDDRSAFVFLSSEVYQSILQNRLLMFSHVEYPEIEAWRASLRPEDLAF